MSNTYNIGTDFNIDEILKKYSNKDNKKIENLKPWQGFRELVLVDKVKECKDIVSFYFKDKNGEKLIKHKAGQYLLFKIKTKDPKFKDILRTYSLSMKSNEYIYRISVKKIKGGLISTYLHENLNIGDFIEAMIPKGEFTLDKKIKDKPIVFIAGGIGITPLLSMLYECSNDVKREKYFIQAVKNSNMQPFKNDLKIISEFNNLKNIVFYSDPAKKDIEGRDYDFFGRITKEWIENKLPLNGEFYFCGPLPFMKVLNTSLKELGVNKKFINFEFF
ncbi:FAD-binding oxidoreductase [Clostridium tarantellae]|uniref:nitric oxide dioxygenase n=1 Tax=Clostridium tarantellae TaxID=39493 RepID=A0A6I1MID3_9CLOT|nr:FAD-binding oxidoreductase [Clostridium tarantellae]MPQ42674.1 oxidoreductase [Clostridium tarantellae]